MAFQLSPGVLVTERDLTTIVPAVATTNAAFAGLFHWGPVNKVVLIDSENNLVRTFGLPDDSNAQYFFSAANFLGYGNNLSVVRCLYTKTGAKNSVANGTFLALTPTLINNEDEASSKTVYNAQSTTNRRDGALGYFVARYPGTLGNSMRVEVCGVGGAGITQQGLSAGSPSYNAYPITSPSYTGSSPLNYDAWAYSNQFDRAPETSSSIAALGGVGDTFHLVVVDKDGLWTGASGTVMERFDNLSLNSEAYDGNGLSKFFRTRINSDSRYIVCPEAPAWTNSGNDMAYFLYGAAAGFTAWAGLTTLSPAGGVTGQPYPLPANPYVNGGQTGTYTSFGIIRYDLAGGVGETAPSSLQDYVDLAFGGPGGSTGGFDFFKDPETIDVNLIIGGPENQSDTPSNTVAKNIKDKITDIRKDCVLFCSTPNSNPAATNDAKLKKAKDYRNDIGSSSYVFIDSGYKYMYDIYSDKYRWVPLNGDIAGLCARTDLTNDPWWSPAGLNRGQVKGAIKLAFNPTATFRDELYKNNINPVVQFPGEGVILYGDKTAQAKPSAFDRINVRRLFIVLEKAIAIASKYSLFEFNDSFTRAQFRSLVEPFLRDVQARRGVYDFKVVCDEKNNTPEVIDGNRFVADIYIKPARSINFIQLNFVATRTGVSFSEVGA